MLEHLRYFIKPKGESILASLGVFSYYPLPIKILAYLNGGSSSYSSLARHFIDEERRVIPDIDESLARLMEWNFIDYEVIDE